MSVDIEDEKLKLDRWLEERGVEKQECPDCGKESYTGLHLCEPKSEHKPK